LLLFEHLGCHLFDPFENKQPMAFQFWQKRSSTPSGAGAEHEVPIGRHSQLAELGSEYRAVPEDDEFWEPMSSLLRLQLPAPACSEGR